MYGTTKIPSHLHGEKVLRESLIDCIYSEAINEGISIISNAARKSAHVRTSIFHAVSAAAYVIPARPMLHTSI